MLGRPRGTARPPRDRSSTPLDRVDPSDGCFNGCGELRPNLLRTYQLVYDGKVQGYWRLCADCFIWGNPRDPRDGDPRSVDEDAA